jgi:hypothetical protein
MRIWKVCFGLSPACCRNQLMFFWVLCCYLFTVFTELPCNPGNPPPGWLATQGRFVAVGGVNTAEDSKYSHSADGFIDFVAARCGRCRFSRLWFSCGAQSSPGVLVVCHRKGGPCQMLRLASLYVCGREFESPLMVHEKVQLKDSIVFAGQPWFEGLLFVSLCRPKRL